MPFLEVGQKAPTFTLPDQTGNSLQLADLLGTYVVIYFYPRALTPGCTVQACGIRDGKAELAARGVRVLGISADLPTVLKKFVEKESLNFTLLSDADHKTAETYGVWQEKSMYGRKYMGLTRTSYLVNKQGVIWKVWPKVSPSQHLENILEAVDALGADA